MTLKVYLRLQRTDLSLDTLAGDKLATVRTRAADGDACLVGQTHG